MKDELEEGRQIGCYLNNPVEPEKRQWQSKLGVSGTLLRLERSYP